MNELLNMLKQFESGKFYGSLEVKFEAGRVTLIRRSENFKPTEPNYNNSTYNHGNDRSVSHDRKY